MSKDVVLGISCYYHDSAAALMVDGKVVAAAEEERFTRKKHDASFPINAIEYCLESQGLTIDDVSHIGFYEKPMLKFERVLYQHLESFPRTFGIFLDSMPSWINQKLRLVKTIRKKLGYKGDVIFIPHHMAHACAAFLVSPFDEAAIVTMDGVGEWTTTSYGVGKGREIELQKEIRFPHSLGLLYSTITAYLGFSVNNSEYKVMGLSAHGDMDRGSNQYYKKLLNTIDIKEDGSYKLDLSYFKFHRSNRMPSEKMCDLLGGPVSKRDTEMTQRHKDIAAALQLVAEDIVLKILKHVHSQTNCDQLVLAGGVALNSVVNGKIIKQTPFKSVWIQPNATDGGSSIGAAAYVHNIVLDKERSFVQDDMYLGPSFSEDEVEQYLVKNNITYHKLASLEDLTDTTARLIAGRNVVGWFQKGMEWGPRALGARSILADPTNPDAQALLNEKVKHREKFRPFAPAVCDTDAPTYFDIDDPIPASAHYMLMVYPVREEWRKKLPSITHVDGSGRLQVVTQEENKAYHDVIKKVGEKTGIPIIINTSFNIRGEPIVCTPHDAYRCMMGTGIDCLVMSNFLIFKNENLKDEWDSESLATD